jgi:V-type H+-transporting ATPase subunit a
MSDILRGEEIALCQIYFQSESTYSCLAQLGELGVVQFRDVINLYSSLLFFLSS